MAKVGAVKRKGKTTDALIEAKDQRWHCRNRITLVFGSNDIEDLETYLYSDEGVEFKTVKFHQAKSKAIEEILDNCIDEYYRGHVTEVHCRLSADKTRVTIEDNGIGFPLTKVPQVYSEFRTGSKFKDEETDEKGFLHRTLGQNGLGAAATCLTSDEFIATVNHYNSKKTQTYTFLDGALKVKKTRPKPFKGPSGVKIELVLSKEVYKDNKIDEDLLRKRIIDLAYNNPGLAFFFNGEKYHYQKGLFELAQRINAETAQNLGELDYVYETINAKKKKVKGKIDLHVSVNIDRSSEERERFISFVNSTPTFDGGFHHDRVRRLFVNMIKAKLERQAKKDKVTLVDNDILTGMTFVVGITMPNPRFESQTKRKLVRDTHLEKGIEKFMERFMDKWLRKNKEYLDQIMERAKSRQRFQDLKEASKKSRRQKKQRIEKLLDANERRDRTQCTLFICEGDSAIGGLRSARNKLYQGGIALRGKPMNVAQATIKDILENQEFSDIMASIGITIGQPLEDKNLRYSKVVFLSDSDVDGGHINTLLTNFFFQFWPEMFERGMIQFAKAPLFEVITDKETVYVETPEQLEKLKAGPTKIREIQRNKGLGEMSPEAFKYVLSREEYTKISVEDMGDARRMLNICFGKDSAPRKELLIDEKSSEKVIKKVKKSSANSIKESVAKARERAQRTAEAKEKLAASKKTTKKKVTKKKTVAKKSTSKKTAKKKVTKKKAAPKKTAKKKTAKKKATAKKIASKKTAKKKVTKKKAAKKKTTKKKTRR